MKKSLSANLGMFQPHTYENSCICTPHCANPPQKNRIRWSFMILNSTYHQFWGIFWHSPNWLEEKGKLRYQEKSCGHCLMIVNIGLRLLMKSLTLKIWRKERKIRPLLYNKLIKLQHQVLKSYYRCISVVRKGVPHSFPTAKWYQMNFGEIYEVASSKEIFHLTHYLSKGRHFFLTAQFPISLAVSILFRKEIFKFVSKLSHFKIKLWAVQSVLMKIILFPQNFKFIAFCYLQWVKCSQLWNILTSWLKKSHLSSLYFSLDFIAQLYW